MGNWRHEHVTNMCKRQSGKPASKRQSTVKLCQSPYFPLSKWKSHCPEGIVQLGRCNICKYDTFIHIYHIAFAMSFGFTWEPCKTHQKHMVACKTWAKGVFAAFTVISCNLHLAKEFPKIRKACQGALPHPELSESSICQAKCILVPPNCATYF